MNAGLYDGGRSFGDAYERYSEVMRRRFRSG
jgi:hypothetical protein